MGDFLATLAHVMYHEFAVAHEGAATPASNPQARNEIGATEGARIAYRELEVDAGAIMFDIMWRLAYQIPQEFGNAPRIGCGCDGFVPSELEAI